MQSLLIKIKKRKEYELKLAECIKPIIPMSKMVDSDLKSLDKVAKNFSVPIHCYFYWISYFECMLFEVLIPLLRAYNLILKRHFYPILLDDNFASKGIIPCTYSEAFNFFQTISVSDRKSILIKWASPISYVSLMECIEHGDGQKFTELFSEIDDVVEKLSSINMANHILSMMKVTGCIINAFSIEDEMLNMERVMKVIKIEEIEEGYEWSRIESVCDFLEDLISEIAPGIRYFTNSIRSNQTAKRIYERLFYPCIRTIDYSNAKEVRQVEEIQEEWGNAREFMYFWKDLADLSFAFIVFLLFNTWTICLSEKERDVINSIINNPDKYIASSRLNAIIRWMDNLIKEDSSEEIHNKDLADTSFNTLRNIKLIGLPYFEVAKKEGFIIEDGDYLKWTKSKILLAYFCGRIYCGDYVQESKKYRDIAIWISGGKHFPKTALEKLFNVTNLAQQRRNRLSKSVPQGAQVIDRIIDTVVRQLDCQA